MEGSDLRHNSLNGSFSLVVLFLAAGLFLVLAVISGSLSMGGDRSAKATARFEKKLHRKERFLAEEFNRLDSLFRENSPVSVLESKSSEYQEMATEKGISVFYFRNGILRYWSDHSIPVAGRWMSRFGRPFVPMRNADYVSLVRHTDKGLLLGLIEIRTHFPMQNDYLVNGFHSDFDLEDAVNIDFVESRTTQPVFNRGGVYLFSLDFSEVPEMDRDLNILTAACMVLFVIFLFAGFCRIVRISRGRARWIWMGAVSLLILLAAASVLKFRVPHVLTGSRLFEPELFANDLFASLGSLLVLSVAALCLVTLFYLYGRPGRMHFGRFSLAVAVILFVASAVAMLWIEYLVHTLVLDSTISFEAHNVTTFSGYTFIGLLVVIIWFIVLGLILDSALVVMKGGLFRALLTGAVTLSAVMGLAAILPGAESTVAGWILIMLLLGGHYYARLYKGGRIPFSRFVFLILFVSVFLVVRLQQYNRIHIERQKEIELVKLSSEHDPVAEMLFSEVSMAIRNDSILARFLEGPFITMEDIDQVVNRLRRRYFSGYWTKYDLQITVCQPEDRLYLEPPDDEYRHCYTFFDRMIEQEGIEVPGSDFYFLDNLNGRISYLAAIPFYSDGSEQKVFIELDSKIFSEELGYPELLLDKDYSTYTSSRFSYAKYNDGQLITRDGEYPYRLTADYYTSGEEMFERVTLGNYDHTVYNVDERNTVIMGSPSVTLVDNLISFSYIFAMNFLLLALVYLGSSVRFHFPVINWNFKNRIQFSMVGILFLTFAMICAGTVYFIIQQYRAQQNDNMRNTMRSVYIELIHKVEFEDDLTNWSSPDYYSLNELLRKFSNVFRTDINLYDEFGNLLATSRSEIFERQLLSRRMNRLVYEKLARGKAPEVILNEHIGEMKYISAYVPLLNSENKFLAYLNLPYFTQSEALTQDVTNLVMAVINIYMILLLVIILLSVVLADRITQPLRVIQNRIAQVSLSEKNEMIQYDRSDEIKGLVEEYNYMVQELERSAELLAQSERESAWREMAKQIAHEIKNPLTPMKLNVQHLKRTAEENADDRAMIERITATLIEQIDSLSAIANEFSDFAKMPRATNARTNLVTKLKNLTQLFENAERADIHLELGSHKQVYVYADKEQLMRVFINLVKNGLQSIPDTRRGEIRIHLEVDEPEGVARVIIRDNGRGIPEEIRDKLFRPNFTTKSGGMGMGLAISHNIIRSLGGKIWYDTLLNRGTTFYVELPLLAEKQG